MITYVFLSRPTKEQIQQIINLYQGEGWWSIGDTSEEAVDKIINGSHCFLVALEDDRIIGMGRAISDRASDAYIQDVTVANTFRGRGIGSEIIKQLISRLHTDGLGWIGLIAEKNSRAFYERLGFDPMPDATPMLRKGIC
jgi:ribosomal protein S18 acetylase RimI-like enzyme